MDFACFFADHLYHLPRATVGFGERHVASAFELFRDFLRRSGRFSAGKSTETLEIVTDSSHLKRSLLGVPSTAIEITGSQMVLVMKLSTFAWNIHDGRLKDDELDVFQKETRLVTTPDFLAFLGYCFFFPGLLVGPSFDYVTYDALVHHRLYHNAPPGASIEQAKATKRRIPYGRKRVAYLHLVVGLCFLGIYATYGDKFDYSRVLSPSWNGWSWLERFGFVQMAGLLARTKYYAVWSLSEGACILTGIGFNGYDAKTGRTLWNRVRNINIRAIEAAGSFKMLFDSWNCRTNVWLKDAVYKRLTKKGRKPGTRESMATFLTSAFWHGIDPGYYLAFIMGGIFSSLGRQFHRFVRPYFLPTDGNAQTSFAKCIYDVLGWFVVVSSINYLVAPFLLLDLNNSLSAWSRMGWYGHIVAGLGVAFMSLGGRKMLKNGLDNRKSRIPPSLKVSPPSPPAETAATLYPEDESDTKDLRWVKEALDSPSDSVDGEGVGMGVAISDHGILDPLFDSGDTPGVTPGQTPKSMPGTTYDADKVNPLQI
nr:lysophospholipid acyltransferase [Cryptococcus depauperatus CBS 7841]